MANGRAEIAFEHKGIGHALSDSRLVVPINQRSYAWEDEHVNDLFLDFSNAIQSDEQDYFLGTIVLMHGPLGANEVVDGQQRLATTTILLAAIRDYLFSSGNLKRATAISNEYLTTTDLRTEEEFPRLTLNVDDNEFFVKCVLAPPGESCRDTPAAKRSQERIKRASELAAEHVAKIVALARGEEIVPRLIDWVDFMRSNAKVIMVRVPDQINAFTMFETLNDRGLRIAQADLLKNYLFGTARDRLENIQPKWASMTGALETIGDDDLTVTYIRHFWITKHGPTRERELSHRIKNVVNSRHRTVEFVAELSDSSSDYVATMSPDHPKWNEYGNDTKKHIRTIARHLRVEQIRPLMFAAAKYFTVDEGKKAFRLFVCWSVRFLVAGGRGGLLDTNYGSHAELIGTGKIATAEGLAASMQDVVPSDAVFRDAFSTARVTQNYLARYYLRALELQVKEEPKPELIPNEDEESVNLEHVLPKSPSDEWHIESDTAAAYCRRLGNLALLQSDVNSVIGNVSFNEKQDTLNNSAFFLTKMIADNHSWGVDEINARQKRLAELAVLTWPLSVR